MSLARPVFNLKAIELGAFFAYFHLFRHLKVIQHFQKYAKTLYFWQAFRQKKKHLKIAVQVSKLGFSPLDPFQVWLPAMATHTKSIAGGHWWAIEKPITAHDLKSVYSDALSPDPLIKGLSSGQPSWVQRFGDRISSGASWFQEQRDENHMAFSRSLWISFANHRARFIPIGWTTYNSWLAFWQSF